jgi:thiol-disulfide isomerase/thioredoxin
MAPGRVRLSRRRLVSYAFLLAVLAVLALLGLAGTGSARRRAPQLPSSSLSGPRVTLASLRSQAAGRNTLVTFWASWCAPCKSEAPALERFARSARGRGRIIGVDFSEETAPARAFIRRYGWTFANLRDAYGVVGNAYRVRGLPTTFVIDSSGRIAGELQGPQTLASLTRALGSA